MERENIIRIKATSGRVVDLPLATVLKAVELENLVVSEVGLAVRQDGRELYASTSPHDSEYPGISVDGAVIGVEDFWLGLFELPNASYPDDMTARLYAGAASSETDCPIALVRHGVNVDALLRRATEDKALTKVVYVDTQVAQCRPWTEQDGMPEHAED